ncbi:helix-turn-helix domain-containing protein [Streptomyces sparsogenes]|uniref:helix-turn-helix domain-containing protein n=1 Tax=Streptomyces sparsogenes TaxID=67365 RepID=UPI0033E9480E
MHRPAPTFQVNGAAIRTRRMQAGLGTGEAAGLAGISERYLNHLENGYRTRMRPKSYAALRTALGLKPDDEQLLEPPPRHEDQPEEER